MTWLTLAAALLAVDTPILWLARHRPLATRWRGVQTRWLRVTWRARLARGEWWVGARVSLVQDAWLVCPLPGVVLVIGRESEVRVRRRLPAPPAGA